MADLAAGEEEAMTEEEMDDEGMAVAAKVAEAITV